MIPTKIITLEEARKMGLSSTGSGIAGAGYVMTGKDGEKGTVIEKTLLKEDGTIELVFMDENRKRQMIERNKLGTYLDQFNKIEGIEKTEFFKKNSIILKKKDI